LRVEMTRSRRGARRRHGFRTRVSIGAACASRGCGRCAAANANWYVTSANLFRSSVKSLRRSLCRPQGVRPTIPAVPSASDIELRRKPRQLAMGPRSRRRSAVQPDAKV
jgi:hypothetical protein